MGYEEYFSVGTVVLLNGQEKIEGIINFDYTLVQVDAKDEIQP